MMAGHLCGTFLTFIAILSLICGSSWFPCANASKLMPSEFPEDFIIHVDSGSSSSTATEQNGTRWAVLVAGSYGYQNYRHQADVCHAYQILKKGGLKDENIIVFMFDDIASNVQNPRPGVIINKPDGPDVYEGVPKDYTGTNVTAANLYAVILGNKTALTGGSGKVLDSGPNDNIFIYYTDHGAAGIIGMPEGDYVYANDLVDVLKQKHEAKSYKNMVRKRTRNTTEGLGSHVTQYGNLNQANDVLFSYLGSNDNSTSYTQSESSPSLLGSIITQRDADLLHFVLKSRNAPIGSHEWHEAREELRAEVDRRKRIDDNVDQIRWLLFGNESNLKNVRPQSQSLVDDWSCFKMLVTTYEKYCGSLTNYGMQYTRVFANMCNAGVTKELMIAASTQTCS
ncbi:hypothetical protein ACE6H2_022940 [Prunus campanulata]